jgi:hypothetical protein
VPSVSGILRDLRLIPDYPEIEYYRKRGTAVHLATCLYDQGKLAEVDDRLRGYLDAWKEFLDCSGFQASLIEHRVHSEQWKYAGTLDRMGQLGGKSTLLDIKSGSIAGYAALQLSGYRRALSECDGIDTERRVAVQLLPDGKFKIKEFMDHAGDDRTWLQALSLHHWRAKYA